MSQQSSRTNLYYLFVLYYSMIPNRTASSNTSGLLSDELYSLRSLQFEFAILVGKLTSNNTTHACAGVRVELRARLV